VWQWPQAATLNKVRFTADQIKDLDFRVVSHIDSHHNFSIPIGNILNIHSLSFFDGISNDHIVIFLCVFGDVLIRKNYESLSAKRFCQLFATFVSKKRFSNSLDSEVAIFMFPINKKQIVFVDASEERLNSDLIISQSWVGKEFEWCQIVDRNEACESKEPFILLNLGEILIDKVYFK